MITTVICSIWEGSHCFLLNKHHNTGLLFFVFFFVCHFQNFLWFWQGLRPMKEILPIHSTGTKGVWQLKPYQPPKQGPRNRTGQLHINNSRTHGRHLGHAGEPGHLPAPAPTRSRGDRSTDLSTKYGISVGTRTVRRIFLLIFSKVP